MTRRRCQGDTGAVTAMTAGALAAFVLLGMLVFGGSAVLRARSDAFGHAASAARTGAQALDETALVSQGDVQIDPAGATAAAQNYLVSVGADGSVSVSGTDVTVTVTDTVVLPMLGTVVEVDASATVSATKGTTP